MILHFVRKNNFLHTEAEFFKYNKISKICTLDFKNKSLKLTDFSEFKNKTGILKTGL